MRVSRCIAMLALILVTGCMFPGQRLLQARVEQDGQLILRTQFGVPDGYDQRAAWRQLVDKNFEVVGTWKPDDPRQATLKGKVRVALVHVSTPFATADVMDLKLVGDPAKGTWHIPPEEVSRTIQVLR